MAILRAARLRLEAEGISMTNENKDPASDQDAIARRAHELFVERGGVHGYHEDDWLRAESELQAQSGDKGKVEESRDAPAERPTD
jgi:hypothetical protein